MMSATVYTPGPAPCTKAVRSHTAWRMEAPGPGPPTLSRTLVMPGVVADSSMNSKPAAGPSSRARTGLTTDDRLVLTYSRAATTRAPKGMSSSAELEFSPQAAGTNRRPTQSAVSSPSTSAAASPAARHPPAEMRFELPAITRSPASTSSTTGVNGSPTAWAAAEVGSARVADVASSATADATKHTVRRLPLRCPTADLTRLLRPPNGLAATVPDGCKSGHRPMGRSSWSEALSRTRRRPLTGQPPRGLDSRGPAPRRWIAQTPSERPTISFMISVVPP